ncbi:hypothetical protein BH10PSE12_BH10PSE12_14620 [soil metagenome]
MSDLMILLLCLFTYVIGGISGMAIVLILRQAKLEDHRAQPLRARARRMGSRFLGA